MASFNISIELRGEEDAAADYRRLRSKMSEHGFRHSVSDKTGTHFRLPRDEYTWSGYATRHEVLDKVYLILVEFIPDPGVMVTEAAGRAWRGLKEIDLS
ncbi:hypothetical protein [Duffyella gerundensis]|uniref:hypothetical protein n=1 Tax=Duffyella gerundensis TaxID=1619313 RepID=UPI001654711B|nr:hypothetical protein [Duffyella gerundensis]